MRMRSIVAAAAAAALPAAAMKVGDPVSDTEFPSTGGPVNLATLKGRWVVLFFYPKAFTPGCTRESCSVRDAHAALAALDAIVFGVSVDDLETQKKFKAAHGLPYELIADPEKKLSAAFGVLAPMGLFAARRTFIIGPDGRVAHVFGSVSVSTHGEDIRAALEKLRTAPPFAPPTGLSVSDATRLPK